MSKRNNRTKRRWTHEIPAYRVHAVRWTPTMNHPLVSYDEETRSYYAKLSMKTHSIYGSYPEEHTRLILPGDYLVTHPDGAVEMISHWEMPQRFPRTR